MRTHFSRPRHVLAARFFQDGILSIAAVAVLLPGRRFSDRRALHEHACNTRASGLSA
jgi:hypothetical protein